MKRYAYHRPRSLAEAIELKTNHPYASFIAGGTDLLVNLKRGRVRRPETLISLRSIGELSQIIETDGRIRIGATALLTDIERHPVINKQFPALVQSIRTLASRQVRNVASMGGNLCNASPCANTAPPLLVHGAKVELIGSKGTREVRVEEIFLGPKQNSLGFDEILSAIHLTFPPSSTRSIFFDKGRVSMDLSLVNLAMMLELDGKKVTRARIAAGAVAPVPLRLRRVETLLEGDEITDERVRDAKTVAMASVSPITDVRSTADYRRHMVGVFFERGIRQLMEQEGAKA